MRSPSKRRGTENLEVVRELEEEEEDVVEKGPCRIVYKHLRNMDYQVGSTHHPLHNKRCNGTLEVLEVMIEMEMMKHKLQDTVAHRTRSRA